MNKTENKINESQNFEIDLVALLKEIVKKLWLILLVGLIVGATVYVGAKVFIKPTYRSGFTAYVNNKQGKQTTDYLTSSDVNAAKLLVLTYQSIIKSNNILTAAAESIGVDLPYESLAKKVSAEVKDDTEIISIYVVDTDPQFAYEYAQAIAKTSPAYMAQIVEGSSMKIIDLPEYSEKHYKPSYLKIGLIGFLIGALLVIIFIVVRYFMDDTIKNESEIESKFALPILGVIPDITKASNKSSDYYYYEQNNKTERVNISESERKNEEK